MAPVIDDYLAYVRRTFTADTHRSYSVWMGTWRDHLGDRAGEPSSWTAHDVEGWQQDLMERLAPSSQAMTAAILRSLIRWAVRHDRGVAAKLLEAVETPRVPAPEPRPLPAPDLDRILSYLRPRRRHAPLSFWRDRALVFYLLTTGARVSEVLQVDIADIGDAPAMVRQKGGRMKSLFCPPAVQEAIWEYVRRRDDDHPALWISIVPGHKPQAMSAGAVRSMCLRLAKLAGVKPFSTHRLRHTCATELLDAGVAWEVIQAHLGHRPGSRSLAGYAEIRQRRRSEVLEVMQRRIASPKIRPPKVAGVAIKAGRRRTPLV